MNGFIDHWRDMTFSYAAVKQLEGKYLVQNRVSGEIYESAQFLYLLVAACLFSKYPTASRLDYIRRFMMRLPLSKFLCQHRLWQECVHLLVNLVPVC